MVIKDGMGEFGGVTSCLLTAPLALCMFLGIPFQIIINCVCEVFQSASAWRVQVPSVPASAAVVNMNPLSVLTSMVLSLYGEHTQLLWQCKHKHMLRSSEWFLCAAKHRECLHPNSFAKGGWDYLTFKLFYKYYGNQDLFWVTPRLSRYKRQILWS